MNKLGRDAIEEVQKLSVICSPSKEKEKLMDNESLWRKLEENYGVEKRWTLKEVAIGLIAGGLYLLSIGLVVYIVKR